MKASDLRIGNIVTLSRELFEIPAISKNGIPSESGLIYCGFEDIEPIPLTEDWLVRMGFKYIKAKGAGGQDMWAGMGFISNGKVNFRGNPSSITLEGYFNTNIKYVHQLQNLYFCLTGTELTIKP